MKDEHAMKYRLPPLKSYDEAQQKSADEFKARRGTDVFGPYSALIRSPEVMLIVENLGRKLRYESVFSEDLKELAIIRVARHFNQVYEWSVHQPIAEEKGISRDITYAISQGARPLTMGANEALIYDCVTELLLNKNLCDASYAAITKQWGERGAMELASIIGVYSTLAYVLNIAGTPPAEGGIELPKL